MHVYDKDEEWLLVQDPSDEGRVGYVPGNYVEEVCFPSSFTLFISWCRTDGRRCVRGRARNCSGITIFYSSPRFGEHYSWLSSLLEQCHIIPIAATAASAN